MEFYLKITMAVVLALMMWRLWPVTKNWLENGPKGSSNDWMSFALVIAAIAGFVILMVISVRN